MSEQRYISIRGAKVNNLKDIDVDIPRGKFIVITGISGSGKSSLAFDTLYAEGQRRYAQSLSSYARQFLGRMSKPDVDMIDGIPPAIAIEQKVNSKNPRSTVATTTEIYDFLRLLFARIGHTFSPVSGREVRKDTISDVLSYIGSLQGVEPVYILADLGWDQREDHVELMLSLKEDGFTRLYVDGAPVRIEDVMQQAEGTMPSGAWLLIDRIRPGSPDEETRQRLLASVGEAFSRGDGIMAVAMGGERRVFTSRFELDGLQFREPDEYLFSFNSPLGACPVCGGLGKIIGISEDLVIPDKTKSIYEGAIACWRGDKMSWFRDHLIEVADRYHIRVLEPYCRLTEAEKDVIWNGRSVRDDETSIVGINEFFEWVETQRYKIQYKYMLSRFSGRTVCHACHGSRLRSEALYVRVGGRTIHELLSMNVDELLDFFDHLELPESERAVVEEPLAEIVSRLRYIRDVGLSYLTLSRASNTLSGGESQRINLVTALGSSLVGSMYILDEPSIGLHPRDTQRLIGVLRRLRDLGNTVVVVEHDEEIIRAADELIDMGPRAGIHGGEIIFQGSLAPEASESEGIGPGGQITGTMPSGANTTVHSSTPGASEPGSIAPGDQITGTMAPGGNISRQTSAPGAPEGELPAPEVGNGMPGHCPSILARHAITSGGAEGCEAITSGGAEGCVPDGRVLERSLTLQYITGARKRFVREKRPWQYSITIEGAMEHNLKGIDVRIPLGILTVVTGVSGSGKSSLVGDILYPALYRRLNESGDLPGMHRGLSGHLERIDRVEYVDQNPIGKSTRSNAVTYLKVYDDIRKLLAEQQFARLNGFSPSYFSFNQEGGRCPECQGDGVVKIEMQFMADVTMVCESCGGKRFKPDVLEVRYREKNIDDILNMSVEEAIAFFSQGKEAYAQSIARRLQPLVDVGLGYIKLGQSSSTLSGGESQRIKLAYFLSMSEESGRRAGERILFIFDEPTTGLHFHDVEKLLKSFDALLAKGHSLVVVEHNLDVIRSADWIIDLGPDAGDAGGEIVFEGTPEELISRGDTWTAKFLKKSA